MMLDRMKFLEENMRTTIEEVLEEAELILEGEEPKRSASAIVSIMKEMLKTMDGELFVEENSKTEEISERSLYTGFPPVNSGIKTLFELEQSVKIKTGRCPCNPFDRLFEDSGIKKDERFGIAEERMNVRGGQIVFFFRSGTNVMFIIQSDSKFYFIPENALEKA